MRLPILTIPISLNRYEDILSFFLRDYSADHQDQKIRVTKKLIGKVSVRFEIEQEYLSGAPSFRRKIAEFEIIAISKGKIELRSAIMAEKDSFIGEDFFEIFLKTTSKYWSRSLKQLDHEYFLPTMLFSDMRLQLMYKYGLLEIPGFLRGIDDSKSPNEEGYEKYRACEEMDEIEQGKILEFRKALNEGLPAFLDIETTAEEAIEKTASSNTIDLNQKQRGQEISTQPKTKEPWDTIENSYSDRTIVELWWGGLSAREISERLTLSRGRVTNRISELRQKYGKEIVPYDKDRRGMLRRNRDIT